MWGAVAPIYDTTRTAVEQGLHVHARPGGSKEIDATFRRVRGAVNPSFNIEDVHWLALDEVIEDFELTALTAKYRDSIRRKWHALGAWPDVPPALVRLKAKYQVVYFTILRTSLVIDVSRRNGLSWDCIVSCEMIRTYKTQPQAYRTCGQWLGYRPDQLLMVACHNFDLMAARAEGCLSAFVHPPAEWGPAGTGSQRRRRGVLLRANGGGTGSLTEANRTSQVPGGPRYERALLFDPGGTSTLGHYRASMLNLLRSTNESLRTARSLSHGGSNYPHG